MLTKTSAIAAALALLAAYAQAQPSKLEELKAEMKLLSEAKNALRLGDEDTAQRLIEQLEVSRGRRHPEDTLAAKEEFLRSVFAEAGTALDAGDTTRARESIDQIKIAQEVDPRLFSYSRVLEALILEAKVLSAEGHREAALELLEVLRQAEDARAWVTSRSAFRGLIELADLAKAERHDEVLVRARALAKVKTLTSSELSALFRIVGASLLQQALANPSHRYHRYAQGLEELEEPARRDGLYCLANRLLAESVGISRLPECWGR